MPDATVKVVSPLGMITVRGDLSQIGDGVANVVGHPVPDRRMNAGGDGRRVHWMSPDELLVTCDSEKVADLANQLTQRLADRFATVVVVSDARVAVDLTGPDADAVLATLTPADLGALALNETRRTRLAQIPAAFWRIDGGYRIVVFRSVETYLHALLKNATGTLPALQVY